MPPPLARLYARLCSTLPDATRLLAAAAAARPQLLAFTGGPCLPFELYDEARQAALEALLAHAYLQGQADQRDVMRCPPCTIPVAVTSPPEPPSPDQGALPLDAPPTAAPGPRTS